MPASVEAILTDIEGTTSSISFVTDVLFPYASSHLPDYVARHPARVAPLLEEVQAIEPGDPVATLLRWIGEDRKATPLKTLQGMIWAEGYAQGVLTGHVFEDAAEALRNWHGNGLRLFVYSSGSVAAQKLIFGHSNQGDLSPLFSGWFDTHIGMKQEAGSYCRIAAEIGLPAERILFLSDHSGEIDAAREAGMQAILIDRSGKHEDAAASFAEISL